MWIEIKNDIFERSDFRAICYLLQLLSWFPNGSIPRYNFFIKKDDINNTENYTNLITYIPEFESIIQKEFDDFINNSSLLNYHVSNFNVLEKPNIFNIEESIRVFSQPIYIILENNKNDAYFIKSIINYFDNQGKTKEHLKNGWIKFENAGGCSNIENFVEGEFLSFEDLAARNNKNTFDYYRAIVILDSDAEFPNQPNKHIALLEQLDNYNIKHHVLQKRMMENYLPNEVFEELRLKLQGKQRNKSLLDWINIYSTLSHVQKDYLKYYDGFNDEFENLKTEIKDLFQNISLKNFAVLKHGFKYEGRNFKNAFPLLFLNSPKVNKVTLQSRCNSNELEIILQKINDVL